MLAELLNPIPAPATRETLEELPFREKLVAVGTLGPTIVIACKDCERVMLLPPTKVTEPELITVVAPAVFPLVLITRALWTLGPPIEITPAPFEETVMLFPPEMVIGPLDKEPVGPIELTTDPVEEIVIVEAEELNPIPAPATKLTLLELPLRLKLVAAGTLGPTIVMLEAPVFKVMFAPAASTIVPVLVARPVPNAAT